jgi:hypothetical protein
MVFQRHHDYQLTIPVLPAGGLTDVPLQLDSDAPFCLRLVKSRNIPAESGWMFQNPKKQFQSTTYRTDRTFPGFPGNFSQPTRGALVRPPMVYPVNAQIVCNIANNTGAPITNARLLFRGSKLYAPGAMVFPEYPARLSGLPFSYQVPVLGVGLAGTDSASRRDNQVRIRQDADFAFRYGVCDPFFVSIDGGPTPPGYAPGIGDLGSGATQGANFTEVYVQLKDEARKPYSNEPIHVDDLLGRGFPHPYNVAGANNDQVLFLPGLFTPEIIVEQEHSLYFDVFREDATGFPVDLYFRFQGMKVYKR